MPVLAPQLQTQENSKPRNYQHGARAVAVIAVCAMGAFCMWLTDGRTGIGWAFAGIVLIYAAD